MERERREAEKSRGMIEKPKGANRHSPRVYQQFYRPARASLPARFDRRAARS
jgi:hypothetical protein